MTKAYLNFDKSRGVDIKTYAYKCVYYDIIKFIHRQMKKRHVQFPDIPDADYDISSWDGVGYLCSSSGQPDPQRFHEQEDTVAFALSTLSEDERELVTTHVIDDVSFRRMEDTAGMTYGGLSKKYRKSISKMQRALNRENH